LRRDERPRAWRSIASSEPTRRAHNWFGTAGDDRGAPPITHSQYGGTMRSRGCRKCERRTRRRHGQRAETRRVSPSGGRSISSDGHLQRLVRYPQNVEAGDGHRQQKRGEEAAERAAELQSRADAREPAQLFGCPPMRRAPVSLFRWRDQVVAEPHGSQLPRRSLPREDRPARLGTQLRRPSRQSLELAPYCLSRRRRTSPGLDVGEQATPERVLASALSTVGVLIPSLQVPATTSPTATRARYGRCGEASARREIPAACNMPRRARVTLSLEWHDRESRFRRPRYRRRTLIDVPLGATR